MRVSSSPENPYGELICRFFQTEFPTISEPSNANLLEIITSLFISTKENRYGPCPLPEQQVVIRKVIATAIERGDAIPVLIPWGGRKALLTSSIDVAEVSALRQVIKLDEAIKRHYSPGIGVNIRIEDTGAKWLYRGSEESDYSIDEYSTDLYDLVNVLRGNSLITPIRESNLMDYDTYHTISANRSHVINEYLTASDNSGRLGSGSAFEELQKVGWTGEIPFEQRNYYRNLYLNMDNTLSFANATKKLADYLGGAKARYELNGRAEPKSDYGFIQLSFVPQIPGAPASIFNNMLYWRTVPTSNGVTHISPWRGKGYLKINNQNDIKMKVTSFGNKELIEDLVQEVVTLTNGDYSVSVEADYLLD